MKKTYQMMGMGMLVLCLLAFSIAENILSQLNIAEQEAKEYIFSNFQDGNLSFPYSAALKKLASGKRAGAVQEIGDYIRKYTNSPEFLEQYNQARTAAMPEGPASKEEKIKKRLEEIKHDISETEKDMKGVSGDMKKLYEATLQMLKTEQKALLDPKDPRHNDFVHGGANLDDGDGSRYKENMAAFNKQYPATVKELVKARLKEFLAMTADMHFDAKMVSKGGHLYFADAALEAKDGLWKRCFRSGPETIHAARAYAQQWLKELN
jgi:hypothetical protein